MDFKTSQIVNKISVSDMQNSIKFYSSKLGFTIDERFTIQGNRPEELPYTQMNLILNNKIVFILGLYKDIDRPFIPLPNNGTVPSFIVKDITDTLKSFNSQDITVDEINGQTIFENISDLGYIDKFFFFRDPDNNSFVIRQNLGSE